MAQQIAPADHKKNKKQQKRPNLDLTYQVANTIIMTILMYKDCRVVAEFNMLSQDFTPYILGNTLRD